MTAPYRAGNRLDPKTFAAVRRETIFECCKWDPQFEDIAVLSDFPIVLAGREWQRLARVAERLDAETRAAEEELCRQPDLQRLLGLPWRIRRALRRAAAPPAGPRVMRFDFHFTTDGWRISEVNSDVPGGFIEASGFTCRMVRRFPGLQMAGDPAAAYGEALARRLAAGDRVAMIHATAYTDDRQVMIYLARHLEAFGLRPVLASPADLAWNDGRARLRCDPLVEIRAIVRFFPAEWLPNLPRRSGWQAFFRGARVPLSNPATALLTQSKRFPLTWPALRTSLDAWQSLLPDTRDPRHAGGSIDDWVFKPALGRVGEDIGIAGVTEAKAWRQIRRAARWQASSWVAQRRFEAVALEGPQGRVYPQFGVYTIDGRAAGIYGRLASRPLIDCRSQDVAVLLAAELEPSLSSATGAAP